MGIGKKLRTQFLTGILVVIPIGVTIWILVWIFTAIDGILQPILQPFIRIPGLGFVIMVPLVYLVGVIASNIGGKRLIDYEESLLGKVPIVRPIYNSIKQIVDSFSTSGKTTFKRVVLVEFPMKGTRTKGFVTNESTDEHGEKLLYIFIPTAPNPTSGFLQIVKEEDAIQVDMSVDNAMKMVISGGAVLPIEMSDKLFSQRAYGRGETEDYH